MAAAVAMAASKVLLFVGASVAGSIMLRNGSLSDFLDDTQKVLMKHLSKENESSKESTIDPSLLAQVTRLRQDLHRLATERSPQVTIVTGGSKSKGTFVTVAVPALILGVSGYGYLRWKGFAFSDLMYVTKRNMSNAVASVSKQMEQVSSALSATKRQLTQRLEHLTSNLNQNMEIQEQLKDEVKEVCVEVARVGNNIEAVRGLVEGMRVKIDSLQDKQELGNSGVEYLCEFVQQLNGAQQTEALPGSASRPRLNQSPPLFRLPGVTGLQSISETLRLTDSGSQPTTDSLLKSQSDAATTTASASASSSSSAYNSPSPHLQRSLTTSFTTVLSRSSLFPRT